MQNQPDPLTPLTRSISVSGFTLIIECHHWLIRDKLKQTNCQAFTNQMVWQWQWYTEIVWKLTLNCWFSVFLCRTNCPPPEIWTFADRKVVICVTKLKCSSCEEQTQSYNHTPTAPPDMRTVTLSSLWSETFVWIQSDLGTTISTF